MKPNRVSEDLIQAGFDAIRAWYAAHPSGNAYLDDREQMRIVLAAALTLRNEQVEQPLRERAEAAERELAELRELLGDAKTEWASDAPGFFFTTPFSTEDDMRRHVREVCEKGAQAVLKRRVVGDWQVAEQQPAGDAGDLPRGAS